MDYVQEIVKSCCITPGEKVLIIGSGKVAISCLKMAKDLGAYVVILEPTIDEKRIELVNLIGADEFIMTCGAPKLTRYGGIFDVVFECSAEIGRLVEGLNFNRKAGRYVQLACI